jgi:hypothetical protein
MGALRGARKGKHMNALRRFCTEPGHEPQPLFRGQDGTVYDAGSIRRWLQLARGPKGIRGKHVSVQLEAADPALLEELRKGSTPWTLPYSIWS